MGKKMRVLLLIVAFLGFMCSFASAEGFYVKFIDGDNSGTVDFKVSAINYGAQTYYTGVADINHNNISLPLTIPADKSISTSVSWSVDNPGSSLICDIYLSNGTTYWWTSQGDAEGSTAGGSALTINWFSGSSNQPIAELSFSPTDSFEIKAVPLPSAFWLFASGVAVLGLTRRKIFAN